MSMINIYEVNETNNMIEHEKLDVRTITLGISLLDCVDGDSGRGQREDLPENHHHGKGSGGHGK